MDSRRGPSRDPRGTLEGQIPDASLKPHPPDRPGTRPTFDSRRGADRSHKSCRPAIESVGSASASPTRVTQRFRAAADPRSSRAGETPRTRVRAAPGTPVAQVPPTAAVAGASADAWSVVANATLENHEIAAKKFEIRYARVSSAAHPRCGKMRAVRDLLEAEVLSGDWLVFVGPRVACESGCVVRERVAVSLGVPRG